MDRPSVCVVGLGYVGLPLANAFARDGYTVYGYDLSVSRIEELQRGHDRTEELSVEQLQSAPMTFSADPTIIGKADVVILAIPTPVDDDNKPDLAMVESASKSVGENMKRGAIIVYESTVYPGTTEEICGPILEKASGMTCGKDFFLGYSPERINPGDKQHTIERIVKVVSGQDEKTTDTLCSLYGSIITAGIHRASSIKVAEMAKAIENAQRDLNIAFVNEIALLCHAVGIPTKDVLSAAGTKWNFLKFQPGLVGGHCIGVDPYYLVEKARMLGMETQVITAGRAVNDRMSEVIADQVHDALDAHPRKILVLGLTFKENVPDTRNSKAIDVVRELAGRGHTVEVDDPYVSEDWLYDHDMMRGGLTKGPYSAILLLVPHKPYLATAPKAYVDALEPNGLLYDMKANLTENLVTETGRRYMAL